jgi:branched-chain amino acid transport system permease protein
VKPMPPMITGGYTLIDNGGFVVQISNIQIIIVLTTVALMRSSPGSSPRRGSAATARLRAGSEDGGAVGVNVDRTISLTFVIGAASPPSRASCSSSITA